MTWETSLWDGQRQFKYDYHGNHGDHAIEDGWRGYEWHYSLPLRMTA